MKGYNYSKDYDALYDFICAWNEALCLVNSEYDLDGRDVCKCKKHNDYNISFKDSWHYFGGVYREKQKLKSESEKDLFIKECNSLNVEWVIPY